MNAAEFKAARERMGLSGAELGKRLGVTGAAVSRYESGKRPISKLVTNAVINLEAAMRATTVEMGLEMWEPTMMEDQAAANWGLYY